MNLCTSTFAYVYSIGLYKRIVNAVTQSIRIANADGQGFLPVPYPCYRQSQILADRQMNESIQQPYHTDALYLLQKKSNQRI